MLDIRFIRENKFLVIKGLKKRNFKDAEEIIADLLELDGSKRDLQIELESNLADRNKINKQIADFYKSGEIEKSEELKKKTEGLKKKSKDLQTRYDARQIAFSDLLYSIPNIPKESVPVGFSEMENEIVFESKEIPELGSDALPHWEIAKRYGLIDFELGSKITGSGFPVYLGKCARLQRGLISYFLDRNTDAGYREVQVPYLVNQESGFGTGQLPDKDSQMYHIGEDDLYLIPTAEIPITNMFRGSLLKEADLPICLTGYTPCFRREAGSYGSDVRGLNRLHQFDKVEIVRIEHPENSERALNEMIEHIKTLLVALGLPYRILNLCSGDLGFTSSITYDFEVFSIAQGRWLEVSSASNFGTFQSNRLKLRYKDRFGKIELAHTLNASSLALPRVMSAILENFQNLDGIEVPKVLIPYTGFGFIENEA